MLMKHIWYIYRISKHRDKKHLKINSMKKQIVRRETG